MPNHRGKFTLTYEGPYVVKWAFFEGAFVLADIDRHDINMSINSDVVIQYFAWGSLQVQHLFLHSYVNQKKNKNKKKQKKKQNKKKEKRKEKKEKKKSKKNIKIWKGRLKTRKGSLGKN